jgi:hypothetical protein
MSIHPSVHLDFARERRPEPMVQEEPEAWEPRARSDQIAGTTFRELAHRVDGGLDVTLLWSAGENRVAVTVFDQRAGELLVLDVEGDEALDVFYNPYAHTASQAA